MNPHLEQLRLALASVEAEIRIRKDGIDRMTWELGELADQKSELLKQIAEATIVQKPCVVNL